MEYPLYYHNIRKLNDGVSEVDLYVNETVPQNIVQRLAARELWGGRRPGTEKYLERSMYQSIFPSFTIAHIDKPPCFLRKFTPDGKSFIAFSADQTSVEVYTFLGPGAGQHLFKASVDRYDQATTSCAGTHSSSNATPFPFHRFSSSSVPESLSLSPTETEGNGNEPSSSTTMDFNSDDMLNEIPIPESPGPETSSIPSQRSEPSLATSWNDHIASDDVRPQSQYVRENIFNAYFKLKFRIPVAPRGEQLNRECSLFTENSKYIVVGSAAFIQDEYMVPQYYELNRSNESVDPNPRYPLEDYTIHIVDIQHGCLCDSYQFKVDKIFLSHNQGIYLYNQTLAILSVQHQAIHLFHITEYGEFHLIRTIGRFCYEDDEFFISSILPNFPRIRPADEQNLGALKHRLLVKIYKNAHAIFLESGDRSYLARFYQYYEQIRKLRIWKMQLLDEDHLLLKYSSEDVVTLKSSEPNAQHCIFAIYCVSSTEILGVYENISEDLVNLFENFSDNFRNNFMTPDARNSSSPANNFYSKQIQQRFRQTITSARFGGPVEAIKRILAQLPISAQSFSASPYLDQALFSYDDHRVSMMERPKACGEIPIRFFGRDSGIYKFQLHAGILARGSSHSGRRLVAFTFHPSSPFAISVQRANAEYLVNFHVRLNPLDLCPL